MKFMKTFGGVGAAALLFFGLIGGVSAEDSPYASESAAITVTILYDNTIHTEGTKADWGFACLIEGTEKTILFDTGTQPKILEHNLEALGVDLEHVELIVISHLHGDHTGGLSWVLEKISDVSVVVPVSFPDDFEENVGKTGAEIIRVEKAVEICRGVYSTGEMGTDIPEQSLVLDTSGGAVVITGCAHPGVVDIVEQGSRVLNKPVVFVFGGFHLMRHSASRIQDIIRRFRKAGVIRCGATHCTGDAQIDMFRKGFGKDFVEMGVGRVISIEP